MYSFFKKLISVLVVLWVVALILNLKIWDRPARDWTMSFWQSAGVQKVYTGVRDRIVALIRKDISVEDVFKSEVPGSKSSAKDSAQANQNTTEEVEIINTEKLSEKDRQDLERILQKSK